MNKTKTFEPVKLRNGQRVPNLLRNVSSGSIYAVFRVKGRKLPHRVSLGTSDLTTAQNLLPGIRREAEEQLRPTVSGLTVTVAVAKYKATLGSLSKNTQNYRTYIIDKFARECGAIYLNDISPSSIEGWLAGLMAKEGLREDSYNKHLNVLRDLFTLILRDCPSFRSPVAHLKAKRVPKGRMLIPSKEEALLILESIKAQARSASAQNTADVATFMIFAGVGNAEVENLIWQDITFETSSYLLHRQKTRQGPFRREMTPKVRELLERRFAESNKEGSSRVFSINNPIKAVKNACKRLSLPPYTPRSLRKHFITECMGKNIPVDVIAKWQNHHDGGKLILDTYSHVTPDREREALAKLD